MSDNYLNNTGLAYYHNRLKTLFPSKTEFDALSDEVDDLIAAGGEPNVIEVIRVNTDVMPVINKRVDLLVPTSTGDLLNDGDGTSPFATKDYVDESGGKIQKIKVNGITQSIAAADKSVDIVVPTSTSDLENEGDGNSPFATETYVADHGGKIDVIKVNGTAQSIVNKAVDITVPTVVSDLTNDEQYQTLQQVTDAIDDAIAGVTQFQYEIVQTLPASGTVGTIYLIESQADPGTHDEYIWVENSWEQIGHTGKIDLSEYWGKTELTAITTAQIDTLFA